jgi:exopolysaccharide production protein ExoQ
MTIPRHLVQTILDIYTVGVLILSTDAFLTLLIGGNSPSDVTRGSPVMRVAWATVYAVTLVRMVRRKNRLSEIVRANRPLCILLGIAAGSFFWSIDPGATLHGAVILFLTTLFALDVTMRYTFTRQIQLIRIALLVVVGLSLVIELALPGLVPGVEYEGAAWHGVFGAKNEFGRITALAVATCMLPPTPKWTKALMIAIGVVLGALARSVGTVGYIAAMVLLFLGWPALKWRPKPRKVALLGCALIAVVVTYFTARDFAALTSMMGRDSHLTGRTTLWKMSLADIAQRPVLGYGYGAFWTKTSRPARLIREESHWEDAPHSHNGYIDLTLGLGLAGLGAYLAAFGTVARRAYIFFMSSNDGYGKWPLTFLSLVFLYQLTESSIVTGDTIFWILFCSLAFSLPCGRRGSTPAQAIAFQEAAA